MFERIRSLVLILGILALSAQGVIHSARLIESEARGAARYDAR